MQRKLFPLEAGLDIRYLRFQKTLLGQLHSILPIKELAEKLPSPKNNGSKPWFDNEAKIALQFLKSYEGCSDEKLLSRINTDWALQFFCGINLADNESIKDKDLIWKTRRFVANHLDINTFQEILITKWKSDLEDTKTGLTDATCYESYIKYPTDVKLLWDCAEWLHDQIKYWYKHLGVKRPRNKFTKHQKKQISYNKQKRKTHKKRRSRVRLLLLLCDKMLFQLDELFALAATHIRGKERLNLLDEKSWKCYVTIGKIYIQQQFMYDNPGTSAKNRIVSLHKPYLRPIVRGKENKRVEFGAKLNTWQVDGLNFVEHFSFDAYHEGNRLKNGIAFHHRHFGKLRRLGADNIYMTNANRTFCKKLNVATNFPPKGRAKADPVIRKQESLVRQKIGKARATLLEGSYGNDKNHYGLRKIKARNEVTEMAWIFFGMMTANAVKMAKRKSKSQARAPTNIQKAA